MGETAVPEAKEVPVTLLLIYVSVHAIGGALAIAAFVRELHRYDRPEF